MRPVQAPSEASQGPVDTETMDGVPPRARWGLLWSGLKLGAGLALVVGAAWAVAVGARNFAVSSDRFALYEFKVEGARRYSEADLSRIAGVALGDNLFKLDLEQAQARLLQDPWIATAQLTRRLPDTLEFRIAEYVPAALATLGGQLYLVTEQGHPIVEAGQQQILDYPVVTGLELADIAQDRARALERVADGLALLQRYERTPLAKVYPAQEVHLAADGAVTLTVGKRGIALMLGRGRFAQKLLMAGRVIHKVRARGETPSLVFLDNVSAPERVVVRLR